MRIPKPVRVIVIPIEIRPIQRGISRPVRIVRPVRVWIIRVVAWWERRPIQRRGVRVIVRRRFLGRRRLGRRRVGRRGLGRGRPRCSRWLLVFRRLSLDSSDAVTFHAAAPAAFVAEDTDMFGGETIQLETAQGFFDLPLSVRVAERESSEPIEAVLAGCGRTLLSLLGRVTASGHEVSDRRIGLAGGELGPLDRNLIVLTEESFRPVTERPNPSKDTGREGSGRERGDQHVRMMGIERVM